jgi:D-amino peptidase
MFLKSDKDVNQTMKIYIMTDMEGVSGVLNHDDWVMPAGRYYDAGKQLLTLEVNAAIEGFFAAGATEIYVADGHGAGGIDNILLDKRAYYIRGFLPDPYPFYLDETFDAIAWVGQHAKSGTPYAHLPHTGWFDVLDYRVNGISVGEFGQFAMCGAFLGVRAIFGSGDEAFTIEAQELIPGIETVNVKKGTIPGNGNEYDCDGYRNCNLASIHMHPEKARELIRIGATKALGRFKQDKESFKLLELKPPFQKHIIYRPNKSVPAYEAFAEHPTDLLKAMNRSSKRD